MSKVEPGPSPKPSETTCSSPTIHLATPEWASPADSFKSYMSSLDAYVTHNTTRKRPALFVWTRITTGSKFKRMQSSLLVSPKRRRNDELTIERLGQRQSPRKSRANSRSPRSSRSSSPSPCRSPIPSVSSCSSSSVSSPSDRKSTVHYRYVSFPSLEEE
jgi:hypothetical protein